MTSIPEVTRKAEPYVMKLDLGVLRHLGFNLYSNVAAVLSEAVANAWDAEAEVVNITVSSDPTNPITIKDDGVGMDLTEANDKFLNVGYARRQDGFDRTDQKKRIIMGRKGIGKLSLFSIAKTIEVHTKKADGEPHAFRMNSTEIEAHIKAGRPYHPTPIPPFPDGVPEKKQGTLLVLNELKRDRLGKLTTSPTKKRLARRFSIIGSNDFKVFVNDEEVTREDRDDINKCQFIWTFGDLNEVTTKLIESAKHAQHFKIELAEKPTKAEDQETLAEKVSDAIKIWGWLGTSEKPGDLKGSDWNLNTVVLFARDRLIQENLLDRIQDGRFYTKYLTGEIHADFLDDSSQEDIVTSDRQRVVEDDERFIKLMELARRCIFKVADQWSELRQKGAAEIAVATYPVLSEWLSTLKDEPRKQATKLITHIQALAMDDESDRVELYRHGILAFERLRLREATHRIEEILAATNGQAVLSLMSDLESYEGSLYVDIVRSRLEVIRVLSKHVEENALEKVLQQHIFKNMWLLDPSWERATEDISIEQTLKREFREFSDHLSDDESKGRLDIRYRSVTGSHIIVELKRAKRSLGIYELADQGGRYKAALAKVLAAREPDIDHHIQVVFILGEPVIEHENKQQVQDTMRGINGRILLYDQLIHWAKQSYMSFLEREKEKQWIEALLDNIAPVPDGPPALAVAVPVPALPLRPTPIPAPVLQLAQLPQARSIPAKIPKRKRRK